MPTLDTGMDISTTGAAAISRQGSSDIGVQREYGSDRRRLEISLHRCSSHF